MGATVLSDLLEYRFPMLMLAMLSLSARKQGGFSSLS
jgi:hypothetical protein